MNHKQKTKNSATLAIIVALVAGTPTWAEEPVDVAIRLVRAGEFDQMALEGVKLAAKRRLQQETLTKDSFECISAIPSSVLTDDLVAFYATQLSKKQLLDATQFFESTAGKKYLQKTSVDLQKSLGFPAKEMPHFSDQEIKTVLTFTASPVGRALTDETSSTYSAYLKMLTPIIHGLAKKCGIGTPNTSFNPDAQKRRAG